MIPVLIITFNFAPYNVTGTFRILKFVKYLPENGIYPIVITADQGKHHINENLLNDIPEKCKVYRLKSFFPDAQELYKSKIIINNKKNSIITLPLKLLKDLLFSPDIHISWVLRHFFNITKIIKKEKIKTIYITGAPFSLFVLGTILKKILKVKLILDYRDCWQSDISQNSQTFIRQYFNKVMESYCINSSDAITSTSLNILNRTLKKPYPNIAEVIPTGYDHEDFIKFQSTVLNNHSNFIFFYSGKFTFGDLIYDPTMLLECLYNLSKEYPIRLIVCGNVSDDDKSKCLKSYNFIEFKGFLNRKELMEIAQSADAFIHFYYPTKMTETISFKLFEYSQYKKPIISLNTKISEVAYFLEYCNIGFTVENDNKDLIIKKLKEVVNINKSQFLESINIQNITNFSIINTTKKLSEVIKSVDKLLAEDL